jgi:NADPH:quinone reductase-like Zn-dependent oxidoreductase
MKAVVCENTKLDVADVPDPVPGKGQLLINVQRAGI